MFKSEEDPTISITSVESINIICFLENLAVLTLEDSQVLLSKMMSG